MQYIFFSHIVQYINAGLTPQKELFLITLQNFATTFLQIDNITPLLILALWADEPYQQFESTTFCLALFGLPAQIETPTTPHALPDVMTSSQGKIYDDKGASLLFQSWGNWKSPLVGWLELSNMEENCIYWQLKNVFENLRRCCDIQYNF